ncbi:MAG: hypothetical protein ACE141_09225 [Bryobacteraceae bacterium]
MRGPVPPPAWASDGPHSVAAPALRAAENTRPRVDFHPIAAGYGHSLAVAPDGTVWAWGWNKYGQLGDGTTEDSITPVKVRGLAGIAAVAASYGHSLALGADGAAWFWGGTGGYGLPVEVHLTPLRINGLTDVAAIAAGHEEHLILKRDGTVWVLCSSVTSPLEPCQVTGLRDVVAIAVGGAHDYDYDRGVAATADGSIWQWVWQYGVYDSLRRTAPTLVARLPGVVAVGAGAHMIMALHRDGTLRHWPQDALPDVTGLSDVAAIATALDQVLALKGNGEVWGVGCSGCVWPDEEGRLLYFNTYGSVPAPVTGLTGVTAIATSYSHGLALKEDGTVWAWGENWFGQLGDGTRTKRLVPAQVPGVSAVRSFPVIDEVVNAASLRPGAIAPGELVSVLGQEIGPVGGMSNVPTTGGFLEGALAQTRVLFDGMAAPMFFAGARQANAAVPYALVGRRSTEIQVEYRGVKSNPLSVSVTDSAPGIFSSDFTGSGQGVILNENGSLNASSNPARRGSIITLFATGEGQTSPPGVDGKVITDQPPKPLLPVSVQIGEQEAQVLEAGCAPGLAGVLLVKARVPASAAPGPAVPITLVVGTARSQTVVTVAVQ